MKSILDPSFQYTSSHQTDVRKTFERIRREQGMIEARTPHETTPIRLVRPTVVRRS